MTARTNIAKPAPVAATSPDPTHDVDLCGRYAIADCKCPCLRCVTARLAVGAASAVEGTCEQ